MFNRMLMLGPAVLLIAACGIDRPHPTDASVAFSAVKFWDAGAAVRWNKLASDLAAAAPAPGINASRLYAYLSLAQLRAAEAAEAAPGPHAPIAAAIGGASVAGARRARPRAGGLRGEERDQHWFVRPPQANTAIVTVFPTPQHPSYPSAHSCFSGALSSVLSASFPSERARMDAVAQESSLSRLYAGITDLVATT